MNRGEPKRRVDTGIPRLHARQATVTVFACVALLTAFDKVAQAGATQIAAGQHHTCAVTRSGHVQCWGNNTRGQLGDGTTLARNVPVDVAGPSFGANAVTAGEAHSCALTVAGGVMCWGANGFGQLGDGTYTDRHVPVGVVGLPPDVRAIAAGTQHTCALAAGGAMYCWGSNRFGQLGADGSSRSTPLTVAGLRGEVVAIAAGYANSVALARDGTAMYWGELGTVMRCYNVPARICVFETVFGAQPNSAPTSARDLVVIAVGHADQTGICGVSAAGRMLCWAAWTPVGELASEDPNVPPDISALAFGYFHRCVVDRAGIVSCSGMNYAGQLGNGTTEARIDYVRVLGLPSGATQVTAGMFHTCVLTVAGEVMCWGANGFGQLGDGTTTNRFAAVPTRLSVGGTLEGAAVEFHHAAYDHYFVTALTSEIASLDAGQPAGWQRTGESFAVLPPGTTGAANVCRFWSAASFAPRSSHFYTPFTSECAGLRSSTVWTYEGEVFAIRLPDAAGACASGAQPLYRLYNRNRAGVPNHRYTTRQETRTAMIAQGWQAEGYGIGVIGCVPAP